MGKKSSSTPDVIGAAGEEGRYSRQIARDKTYADRPDVYTPFGSTTWSQSLGRDPAATPNWRPPSTGGGTGDGGGTTPPRDPSRPIPPTYPTNPDPVDPPYPKYPTDPTRPTDPSYPIPTPPDKGGLEPMQTQQYTGDASIQSGQDQRTPSVGGSLDDALDDYYAGEGDEDHIDDGRVTRWEQRNTLTPEAQRLFDAQLGRDVDLAELAQGMSGRIQNEMGSAPDWEQFGDVVGFDPTANRQAAEDAAYGRSTRRLDPQFDKRRQDLERQLSNRGLRAGDSAYDSAMNNFSMGRNDAYEMARMGATGEGRQEVGVNLSTNERANALRQQQIEEYLGQRGHALGESQALTDAQNTADMVANFTGGG